MWEETIMLFPTQRILLSSGPGGKSLSSMARAGLASPALHTNALNDLALSPVEKLPKCRSQCDFFFIDTTLLTSLVKSLFCSLLSHSSLLWHLPAPGSQAAGDSRTHELWLVQHQNSHPSCPKSGTLPVMHQDKVTHLGSTGKMGTLLTYTLQDLFCWKRSSCFSLCSGPTTATKALLLSSLQPAQ